MTNLIKAVIKSIKAVTKLIKAVTKSIKAVTKSIMVTKVKPLEYLCLSFPPCFCHLFKQELENKVNLLNFLLTTSLTWRNKNKDINSFYYPLTFLELSLNSTCSSKLSSHSSQRYSHSGHSLWQTFGHMHGHSQYIISPKKKEMNLQ